MSARWPGAKRIGASQDLAAERIRRKVLWFECCPDPFIGQFRYQVNPDKSETIAADRLDMPAFAGAEGKIIAIEADARQVDPVCFHFDGWSRKLYLCVRGCQSLLAIAIPH